MPVVNVVVIVAYLIFYPVNIKRLSRDSRELETSISDLPFLNAFSFHSLINAYFLT